MPRRLRHLPRIALLWALVLGGAHADPEQRLLTALQAVQATDLEQALSELQTLTDESPRFKPAQLVYADLLFAKAGGLTRPGGARPAPELSDVLAEVQARWQARRAAPPPGRVPRALIHLDPAYRHAVVVDLGRSRLYLFENRPEGPRVVADYYVSMGKNGPDKRIEGDNRTPLGVYFVADHIGGERLPDLYGVGAYPINYPNLWDRRQGRTGHGIWLHGTPSETYSRPPRASEGCIVLANPDLLELGRHVDLARTPVVIGEAVEWVPLAQWAHERRFFRELVEQWRRDWESRDPERYLAHYSRDFQGGGRDYAEWAAHKRRVNAAKDVIRVRLDEVSELRDPNRDLLVVTFHQDYYSDTYASRNYKRQYWRREADGRWRIIAEEVIDGPGPA